ncbi:MAG: M16 family metallopeptidase [Pyrinomonadaceae bacterium]
MNEDFRKSAPAPLAPIPFEIPQPFETVLPNGLKVVMYEDKRLPLVSFRLAFRSGEVNDPKDSIGLTSAMTSMLSEGTKTRTSKQLAEEIERLGANVSASSNADNTVISASALSLYSSDILRLMAEITLFPTFPESELKLYKQNTIENLKFQRSQPGFLAEEQTARLLYGSHPYSITSPKPADVEKITRQELIQFHEKMFVPENAIFIVVGDANRESILKEIEENFGHWTQGSFEEMYFPMPPARTETTVTIVDRPGSAQSNIVLSNPALERTNPDYFPLLVMNQILGAGASSRLFMNLREEKGYTYGAYSSLDARRLAGAFEATSEVRTPVTGDSLKEFFYELNRIRDEKVSEGELKDAKNFLSGVFPIRVETQEGLTNLIVSQQLYNLPADYLQTYRHKINEITIEDVERAAKKYITPEKLAIVVVGDAEEVLPQVNSYSDKIEVFDTEGNPVDIVNYGKESNEETADVTGKWNLIIDFQGQKLPVTLILEQKANKISGSLESMLGRGEITDGKVKGNKFFGTAQIEAQGQSLEVLLQGDLPNENEVNGTLSAQMDGMPDLPFTGKKVS